MQCKELLNYQSHATSKVICQEKKKMAVPIQRWMTDPKECPRPKIGRSSICTIKHLRYCSPPEENKAGRDEDLINITTHCVFKKPITSIKFELNLICNEEVIKPTRIWCCNHQNSPTANKKETHFIYLYSSKKQKIQLSNSRLTSIN